MVLGGQTYLMLLGHATIGWRTYSDSVLIVYTLKDGALESVASAIVKHGWGALMSIRVRASK